MIKRIMPSSIRSKIMLCTGAITLLIAAVTVSICFVVFQSFLRRNQIQSAEYNLQVVSHNVSNDMDNIIYFNKWCTSSTDIIQYLEGFQTQVKMPSISSAKAPLRSMALNAYNRLKEEFFKTSSSQYTRSMTRRLPPFPEPRPRYRTCHIFMSWSLPASMSGWD